ncbi:hypothetical protein [Salinibacter ruber]|uniref:DNA-directed RNA polymerase n=1 Tax=Salinibacter ruber TaxID=146919 RepID=A0AAW5P971_9BACT|nr:hypothetical protein [Salinibacter ruber]MCS4157786.1 DNA-directed RNA polymerase beta subunit/DNA-directed RNA polymerase beta' subunit [Salinibacter ruber]
MSSLLTRNEDQEIETEVQKALRDMMPLESDQGDVQIDLKDVHIDKSKDDLEDNPGYINDARAKGKSYEVPMKGTFQLKKDGEVLQEHDTKIGPYYPVVDNLGTRMINGMHYQNKFQVRREPGIYPTRKEGDAMVEFNSQQGGSFNFVVDADNDDTPTLDVQVIGQSRKTVERGVYALLKVFEVPESEIQDIMGDFYKYNHQDLSVGQAAGDAAPLDLENVTKKIFTGITPNKLQEELPEGASFEEMAEMLRDFLTDGKAFESDVNRKTIDVETEKYSAETIKQSARKLVQTLNGRENPTHRFSEEFRRIHGIPTQLRENLKRDSKLKGKMSEAENRIDDALQSGETPDLSSVLSSVKGKIRNKVQSTYKNSALSTTTETNNILDIDNRGKEITIKGPGGIQSEHAIQPENIELHPSRLGLIDVVNTPTGSPGRSMPLAKGARIGEDGEVQREVYDRKQGEKRIVSAQEIAEGNIGFADDFQREETEGGETYEPKQEEVYAGVGNEVKQVPEEEVRYVLPDMTDMLADGTNIVPFVHHNSGPRAIMGARQMAQGVSLKDAESPLVDPVDETGETFSKRLGHRYNVTAEEPGTVKEVQEEAIVVETDEGEEKQYPLFNDLPLNQGGFIDHSVKVDPGDQVEEGDLMTTNNYTDEEGKLAVGKNLDVAYMPMSGFNYEDSMVMSEKGAEKLTSEHVYEKVYEAEPNDEQGLDIYSTHMRDRGKLGDLNRDTLGADGIIQEGATVEEGDALVTAIGKANLRNDPDLTRQLKQTFKEFGIDARDRSVYWNKPDKGVVTRVETDKDGEGNTAGVRVYVKTEEKFKEGDKITVRAGGKGITSKVLPEDKMPKRKRDGKVPDLLVDPHGVPSRANVGQIFENAAGKVADKKGETYKVKNFDNRTDWEDINQELEELGIDVQEDFEHPETGETIPDVNIGKQYVAKLKHMLNKKFDARGVNEGYDMDEQPVGGASMDNLTVHSMIGHNARANLSEMAQIKGTENQDYWYDFVKGGRKPRVADTPFSFDKFKSMIESLGVSVEEDQKDAIKLTPMTDKDIQRKSAGEIENPGGYQTPKQHDRGYGRQKAVTKGLFDPNLVGEGAENWNHIELPEPVPNPLFKKGLQYALEDGLRVSHDVTPRINKANGKTRTTSNMTQKDVKNLYIGDASVEIGDKTYSGGEDLKELLSTIDVDKTMEEVRSKAEDYMQGDFKAERADMYKSKLKFLGNLQENDVAPEDAFMLSKVPVMPGKYRRPLLSGDGKIHRQPTNKLYGEVLHGKEQLNQSVENYLGEEEIKQDRKGLMQDLGALFGDGSSPRGNIKAKSIMDQIAGGGAVAGDQNFTDEDDESQGPKGGYAQRKVMKKKQDLSGRSTIIPSGLKQIEGTDALGVDEVGLPEEMAWTIYEPFVRNELSKELGSAVDAKEEYEDRTDKARKELRKAMEDRPVLLNRDPSWWQHNVTAHEPKLISEDPESNDTEKAIRVPNQVVAPFQGGDFDGDSVSLNTPVVLRMANGLWEGQIKELITQIFGEVPSENLRLPFVSSVQTLNSNGEWVSVNELTVHQTDKPTYEVETRGGYAVRVTSDHSMMVGGEEVAPQDLEAGEDVLDNVHDSVFGSGREVAEKLGLPPTQEAYTVRSVEQVEQEPVVADMTVEGDHVFCVGPGIIVHNTMSAHVPVTDAAVNEAHSMKPSRNLRAPGSKKLLVHPDHSQLLGLHDLSQVAGSSPVADGDPEPKNEPDITDKNDLIRKYNTGDVKPHQPFKIQGEDGDAEQWTPGWALIDDAIRKGTEGQMGLNKYMEELQSDHPDKDISMRGLDLDDEGMEDVFLEGLVRRFPEKYADISHKLSMLGSQHATKKGFTVGFDDVKPEDSLAEKHYEQSEQYIGDRAQIIAEEKGKEEPDEADYQQAEIDLNMGTDVTVEKGEGGEEDKTIMGTMKRMEKEIKERDGDNPLVRMMQVGSRSSPNQIRQLLGTFGMVKDVHKNRVPRPVKNSLNRGLKGGEYYLQQHGALMGLRDRSVETSKPGYLGKQIIAGSQDLVVTERDCGTTAGKEIPLKEGGSLNTDDLNGRFLAESGEEIDGSKLAAMERAGQETVKVRSPLTCESEEGVCAACYGRTENGNMPDLGENVGVREGQGIIEASTKLTLKAMHETGSADKTAPSFDRFQEIVQLKSPNFKAHIAEGEPGESFEIEETEDVFAQGGKVGTDVTYTSKDKGETRSTRIPPERRIRDKIEPGAELEAGEKITEAGHFDPDEMQKTKGLEETRDYLTRELHTIFNEIGGINRRGAETTLAAMTDFARVRDPGDSDFVPGENVQSGKIEAFNQQAGDDEDPVVAEGQLTPVGKVPFHGENWLSKMNFQNLKRELTTSAQEGHEAEIRGTSPVSAYMYGKGFDKGLDPDRWEF